MCAGVRDLWGEDGLRDLEARLPDATREATRGPEFAPLRWYPTRYLVEWHAAMMDGPAGNDEAAFRRGVARSIDFGFGRVRRVLLSIATPMLLAERAAVLWRHENTHGVLAVDTSGRAEGKGRVTLTGHPFVRTPLSRKAFAEVLRHILSLSRAQNVRESHAATGEALVVALTWDP
jgi:hypothetical protein